LPIYRWRRQTEVFQEMNDWWRTNADSGRVSLVYAYSLGKAQRILAGLDCSIGPIYCHGAIQRLNHDYQASGITLPATRYAGEFGGRTSDQPRALVLAPPSARASPWLRRFGDFASGFASGWMQIRGARRRRAIERGFVLSDHADWSGLHQAIRATGAERILVTHGVVGPMVRWLREQGWQAGAMDTRYEGEQDEVGGGADELLEGGSS
jgi:putative mRNA 3-end processing factor